MNVIIPLGGKGNRFVNNGFIKPKPLINILDKCMIEYVIDNINLSKNDKVFIIYNYTLDDYDFVKMISEKYPYIILIRICDTKGAVETLFKGIDYIFKNNKSSYIFVVCWY